MNIINYLHLLLVLPLLACAESKELSDKTLKKEILSKYLKLTKNFSCPTISAEKLKNELNNKKFLLIDVRDEKEQSVSMLPGAITVKQFEKNIDNYKGKKLIAYCTIGYRSGKFASKHTSFKITNLIGGVLMWSHCQGNFVNQAGETKKVHTYSSDWNFLHSKYEAVLK
jgi:rhodanese-related sulfurtransferase